MKQILIFLLSFTFLNVSQALACDIEVSLQNKNQSFQTGNEFVVVVQVTKTHRMCRVDINETTYEPNGLKVLSATDWKETSPGVWQRKMKLKVTGNAASKLAFYVRRKCNKENSVGSLVLNSKPVENKSK
jgi:hypothetical protein